jgi:hypothetical protein
LSEILPSRNRTDPQGWLIYEIVIQLDLVELQPLGPVRQALSSEKPDVQSIKIAKAFAILSINDADENAPVVRWIDQQGGSAPLLHTVVDPGGTTTVVFLAGGAGLLLLMHPAKEINAGMIIRTRCTAAPTFCLQPATLHIWVGAVRLAI